MKSFRLISAVELVNFLEILQPGFMPPFSLFNAQPNLLSAAN